MAAAGPYRIAELARLAGVTPRTVRYYVAERLLPSPTGAGPNRLYDDEHLRLLRAIRRLKSHYLPLGEIRRRLAELAPDEITRLTAAGETDSDDRVSAVGLPPTAGRPLAPVESSAIPHLARLMPLEMPIARPMAREVAREGPVGGVGRASPAAGAPLGSLSTWRRLLIASGVELHYDVPADPEREAALLDIARYARARLDASRTERAHLGFRPGEG